MAKAVLFALLPSGTRHFYIPTREKLLDDLVFQIFILFFAGPRRNAFDIIFVYFATDVIGLQVMFTDLIYRSYSCMDKGRKEKYKGDPIRKV